MATSLRDDKNPESFATAARTHLHLRPLDIFHAIHQFIILHILLTIIQLTTYLNSYCLSPDPYFLFLVLISCIWVKGLPV